MPVPFLINLADSTLSWILLLKAKRGLMNAGVICKKNRWVELDLRQHCN